LRAAHKLFSAAAVASDHLRGLRVWIGASRQDRMSVQMKNLYSCVLKQLGVSVLDNEFEAILEGRVAYDVIVMLTFTPGTSARAIEFVITSELRKTAAKDKLHVYMPAEFRRGYICRRLERKILAGKLCYGDTVQFQELDNVVWCKCVKNLIDVVNDRNREMELVFKPRIAILTALPKEFGMMECLLSHKRHDRSLGDEAIQYLHGRIGQNCVVLGMTGKGNNLSAAITATLYEKYPSVQYTFLVGIAGGIPDFADPANSVRLGDIVIGDEKGILQYDRTKQKADGPEDDFDPRPVNATLLKNTKIYVEPLNGRNYGYWDYLDTLLNERGLRRPSGEVLDESPWIENGPEGIRARLPRNRRKRPRLHFGPIASANTLLKDIGVRNRLRTRYRAKAVEMEASGVADAAWLKDRSCFVVRGICDYANPDKNDVWQEYAAAAAAAFACEIIEETLTNSESRGRS
jgi:nucleoside phosphorylase